MDSAIGSDRLTTPQKRLEQAVTVQSPSARHSLFRL